MPVKPTSFKITFLGSSSFVIPILDDIYKSNGQRLGHLWLNQLHNLVSNCNKFNFESNDKQRTQISNSSLNLTSILKEADLLESILPKFWLESEMVQLAKFVSTFLQIWDKANQTPNLVSIKVNLQNEFQQLVDNFWPKFDTLESQFMGPNPNLSTESGLDKNKTKNNLSELLDFTKAQLTDKDLNQIRDFFHQLAGLDSNLPPDICREYSWSIFWLCYWLHLPVQLSLVISQPDRINRNKMVVNPISSWARSKQVVLETPLKINQEIASLQKQYEIQAGIVASFGQILNSKVLTWPTFDLINWHPSKLPKYRGPTPIQTALASGDFETALSWIKMSKKMDAGPIWLQLPVTIETSDTFDSLALKMGQLGATTWTLPLVANLWKS